MLKPNPTAYYMAAVIIGLAVGIAIRDMPVGIILSLVLIVAFATRKKGK